MPIEFSCPQCQHRLRTPDDSAGKKSRCPQCGHIQAIPDLESPDLESPDPEDKVPGVEEIKPLPASNLFDVSSVATPPLPSDNPFADVPQPLDVNPYTAPMTVPNVPQADPRATIYPGICLITIAATSSEFLALGILAGIVSVIEQGVEDEDVFAFLVLGVTMAMQFLILWGGINMVRRRGYAMAMVGAIAAIVPLSACWCLNLPIGVWAAVTLTKGGMQAFFSSNHAR